MRFRTAILAVVFTVTAVVLTTALVAIFGIVDRSARARLVEDVERDGRVLLEVFRQRVTVYRAELETVAGEPRVRAVAATPDVSRDTVLDVMSDLQQVAHFDLFVMLDADGKLVADAARPKAQGEDDARVPVVQAALADEHGIAGGLWAPAGGDAVYLAQAARLSFGPTVFGVLVLGHRVDGRIARDVGTLTGGMVTLRLDGKPVGTFGAPDEEFLTREVVLPPDAGGPRLSAVVGRSLTAALAPGRRVISVLLLAGALALLLAAGVAAVASRRLGRPIEQLVATTDRIGSGDLTARTGMASGLGSAGFREVKALAGALDGMAARLQAQELAMAEKRRLEQELDIAKTIQLSILPRELAVAGLEIAATMRPAEAVGGDYYDVLPDADGAWIAIGDVAGHGLKAGLIGLMVQSIVSTLARHPAARGLTPRELLIVLNRVLHDNVQTRMVQDEIVTLTLLRYSPDGKVIFAGAHEEILIRRRRTGKVEGVPTPGTWVGAVPDISAHTHDHETRLEDGDVMLLYTDGITEAMDAARQQFGFDRLCLELERAPDGSVEQIRDHLLAQLGGHMAEQRDDVTLVVTRYRG